MKDSFSRSIYLDIGIIAGSFVIAIAALVLLSSDVTARAQAILTYRSAVAARNTNLETFAQLQKDAATAAGYQAVFNQLLPSQDSLIDFPQNMTTVGESFNVEVSVSFDGDPVPTSGDTPGYVAFSLRADGTNADLLGFLKYVESQSPQFLVAIDSTDLAVDDPSSRLTATGRVFFQ